MNTDPNCSGALPAAPGHADPEALPPGTRFGEFEILRVLGHGGFGIVYLAHDHSLERAVALKEYMPAALATRGVGAKITVRSGSFAETYAMGLRSFVNEARLLARFDHPSLLKVYRFWEDNATAYTVMPYLQGPTLRAVRLGLALPPTEAWLRGVLGAMLDAVEVLHTEGVYHRDIAPDNIVLPPGGVPVLLDFGAARRVIGDRALPFTAILKPSYAPIEQYAEMGAMRQGPWTDLYALGAVMHFLLFGEPPAPATVRAVQDDEVPIAVRGVPADVSRGFVLTIGWMLGVRPMHRPQSVAALRAVLAGDAALPRWAEAIEPLPPAARVAAPGHRVADQSHCTTVPMVVAALGRGEDCDSATEAPHAPAPTLHISSAARSVPPGSVPPVFVPGPRPAVDAAGAGRRGGAVAVAVADFSADAGDRAGADAEVELDADAGAVAVAVADAVADADADADAGAVADAVADAVAVAVAVAVADAVAVVRADPVPPDALDPGAAAAPTSETPRLPLPLPLLPSPRAAAPARSRSWPTFGARRVVAALAVVAVVGVMTAIFSPRAPNGPVADLATAASTGTRGPAIREPAVRPEPRSEAVARSLAAAPLPAVDASGLNPLRMTAVAAGSASAAVLVAPLAALRLGPAASEDVAAPPTATKRAVRAVSRKDVARQRAARLAEGRQAPPPPASAREVCAGGHFIARAMCMDRECERPPYRQTAECTRVLSVKRERIERRAAL